MCSMNIMHDIYYMYDRYDGYGIDDITSTNVILSLFLLFVIYVVLCYDVMWYSAIYDITFYYVVF